MDRRKSMNHDRLPSAERAGGKTAHATMRRKVRSPLHLALLGGTALTAVVGISSPVWTADITGANGASPSSWTGGAAGTGAIGGSGGGGGSGSGSGGYGGSGGGGNGGTVGGQMGGGGGGGAGSGGGGGGGNPPANGSAGTAAGGAGNAGGSYGGRGGGGGGGGGTGATFTTGLSLTDNYIGGLGGNGANGASLGGISGGAGGGGGGGVGLVLGGAGEIYTIDASARATGGNGGNGGSTAGGFSGGGGGGAGGHGVLVQQNAILNNYGTVTGGVGGNGGGGASGGWAGGGGYGALVNNGTLNNYGTATGGAGASGASGGAGIVGSNATIVNYGTISSYGGSASGVALSFTGGTNRLQIMEGSTLTGRAVGAGSSTLAIDATNAAGTFSTGDIGNTNAFKYQNFTAYEKTGANTLTLTGTTTLSTPWSVTGGTLIVSNDGALGAVGGALTLNGGALETTSTITTARSVRVGASNGTVSVDSGTSLTLSSAVTGTVAGASLTKTGTGTLILTNAASYTGVTTVNQGTLQLGNGGTTGSVAGDITNNANLVFNRSNDFTYAGILSGTGTLGKSGSGQLTLTGTSTMSGATTVSSGSLRLMNGGSIGGAMQVQSGATLTGDSSGATSGSIGGAVTIQSGATLRAVTGATTLTMDSLALDAGSIFAITLNAPSLTAAISVTGNLDLNGTINLANGSGLAEGTYRLFDYAGTQAGSGLTVGTVASTKFDYTLDYATAGVINLIVESSGYYWNGTTTSGATSAVAGGNGTWSASATTNWTDEDGVAHSAWPAGKSAIFAGAAGTVTVDNGSGAVTTKKLSFVTSGYAVNGGALTLTKSSGVPEIEVVGAATTATVNAPLAGTQGFEKTGAGTLVLGGVNTYTGDTLVSDGVLNLTGEIATTANTLTANGGEFRTTTGGKASLAGLRVDNGGSASITGTGSNWTIGNNRIGVGVDGTASLSIGSGATVSSAGGVIGWNAAGDGTVTVSGTGASWANSGALYVGNVGKGTLNIASSGTVSGTDAYLGTVPGSQSLVSVSGSGSKLELTGALIAGYDNNTTATVNLSNGGKISGLQGTLGDLAGSSGTMTVSGAGSAWSAVVDSGVAYSGFMNVGRLGTGDLTVSNGGSVNGYRLYVANETGSTGTVSLAGAGSLLEMTNNLYVGADGAGTLTLSDGAIARAAMVNVAYSAGSSGTINIGSADGQAARAAGVIDAGQIRFLDGTGKIVLNHTDTNYVLASAISGAGELTVASGNTVLTGANTFTGGTTISGGSLSIGNGATTGSIVGNIASNGGLVFNRSDDISFAGAISGTGTLEKKGAGTLTLSSQTSNISNVTVSAGTLKLASSASLASTVTVKSGATLEGSTNGTDISNSQSHVVVESGGRLVAAPTSGGTAGLSMASLTLQSGGTLVAQLGAPYIGAAFSTSAPVLNGTVDIVDKGMSSATYTVLMYSGSATGSGLTLGNVPQHSLFALSNYTSGFGYTYVNLQVAAGQWWNGSTTSSGGTSVAGGSGTWDASGATVNWTGESGSQATAWGQGGVAIFAGQAGTVTVASSVEPRTVGMEFLTDGYSLTGGAVTLASFAGAIPAISVGDGSPAASGWTATIASALTGADGLNKTGAGTLALTGANSYTGGTTVSAGTLSIGNGGTGGTVLGNIANNAALVFNRGNDLSYAGVISGTGSLEKQGAGTLTLTASQTHTGGTTISGGALSIGDGGTTGAISGAIVNNATLIYNRSDDITATAVTGTGAIIKRGGGILTLSGANSAGGGTIVENGTLAIGNGVTLASNVTVRNGATLRGEMSGTLGASLAGAVAIEDGGSLTAAPTSTSGVYGLAMNALTLSENASINLALGSSTGNAVFSAGTLTLDGVLNVSNAGSMALGVYRIFDYTTLAADNGLRLGAMPTDFAYEIQQAAGQVNLGVLDGSMLYWNGATTTPDGTIHGGTGTWTASATTNWLTSPLNQSRQWDDGFAVFNGTAGTVTVDNGAGAVSATGMQFMTDGYTVTGDALTLAAGSGRTQVRVGDGTPTGATFTATIGAALQGTTGLEKTDFGTLILTGANSYTGGTAVTQGILQIGNGGTSGSLDGDVMLASGTQLSVNRSDAVGLSGAISGAGALVQAGAGTLTLTGAANHGGGTTVSAGTLQIGDGGTTGMLAGNIVNNGHVIFNRADTVAFAGQISGSGTFEKAGAGTLALGGTQSFTGATTVSGGRLDIAGGASLADAARLSVLAGATLALTDADETVGSLGGGGMVALNGHCLTTGGDGTSSTFSGSMTGSGCVNKAGSGTLTLSGVNTYTGGTTIEAGALQVSDATALGSGPLALSGNASLRASGTFALNQAVSLTPAGGSGGGTFDVDGLQTLTLAGTLSGDGALTKAGTGTLILSGTNAGTGATAIAVGTLVATGGQALSDNAGVNVASGAQFVLRNDETIGSLTGNGGLTLDAASLTLGSDGLSTTFAGVIDGSGGLFKIGGGTLTLSGVNTYTGGTTIAAGTLQASAAPALGSGPLGLSGDASLRASGTFALNQAVSLTPAGGSGGGTFDVDGLQTLTLAGTLSGNGTLSKAGAGTLILSGTNTGTGATAIAAGTLVATGGQALSDNAGVNIASGAQLILRNDETIGSLTGNGGVTLDTANLTLGGNNLDTAFAGAFDGSGGLIKAGAGTLTLSGTNSYTGDTRIQSGTLVANGSFDSDVYVHDQATLSGAGTIARTVHVLDGGTLAGADGNGLTMGGLVLSSGAKMAVTLGLPDNAAIFNVNGDLTLGGTLDASASAGFGLGIYRIISYSGALTDDGMTVASMPSGFSGGIQTSVAGAVNLFVEDPNSPTVFWNGTHTNATQTVLGGTGIWSADARTNWINASGTTPRSWNSGFAIFQGTPGEVTVDGTAGQVSASGMQFVESGYSVSGDAIALTASGLTTIRVGDGTTAGSATVATIASALTGTAGLEKTDYGRLILTGANSYTGGTTISQGSLQIGNGGTSGSIAGNVVNNATLVFNRADDIDFAGQISGSGALVQSGPGTLTLSGANSYTGGTTIASGTLIASTASLTGDVANNGTLILDQDTDGTFAGTVSGSGDLVKNGASRILLTGANSYTGLTRIIAGTLAGSTASISGAVETAGELEFAQDFDGTYGNIVSGTGSLKKTGTGRVMLSQNNLYEGGTLISGGSLAGFASSFGSGAIVNEAALVVEGGGTFANVVSGSGSLDKTGTGNLVVTGANSYTGGTTISQGSLQIGNGGTSGSIAGNVVNNATLVFNRADDIDFAGQISGSGALVQSGPGTLTLSGANSYTGGTTIASGTLIASTTSLTGDVANNGTLILDQDTDGTFAGTVSGSGDLVKNGASRILLTGANSYTGLTRIIAGTLAGSTASISGAVETAGELEFAQDFDGTYGNIVSGTGSLKKTGTGRVMLSQNNLYEGGTLISGGSLAGFASSFGSGAIVNEAALVVEGGGTFANVVSGSGSLDKTGTGNLVVTGANSYTGGTTISQGSLQIGNGGTSGSIAGNVVNNATLVFNRADDIDFAGQISGSGALVQSGPGTLTLSGANSYTGGTTIASGTLIASTASLTGDVANNGTLILDQDADGTFAGNISGLGDLVKDGAGIITMTGNLTYTGTTTILAGQLIGNTSTIGGSVVNAGRLEFDQNFDGKYDSIVSGTGSLRKSGSGTLTLTRSNTYSGGTEIAGGTLAGFATSFGTGAILNNGKLVVDGAGTFANIVSGAGSFEKTGFGKLLVTGINSYTGGTLVSGGTLSVNGGLASFVTVASGATLGGSGTIGGLNVMAGGRLAPGNSIGTLNSTGNASFASGSTYAVEVDAAGRSDRLAVNGTITIGNDVTLAVTPENGTDDGSTYALSTRYTILTATSGISGSFANVTDDFAYLTASTAKSADGGTIFLTLEKTSRSLATNLATPNQRAAAAGLEAAGSENALYQAALRMRASEQQQAFAQLAGDVHPSVAAGLLDRSRLTRDVLLDRLQESFAWNAYPVTGPGSEAGRIGDISFWANGFGAWDDYASDGNGQGMDVNGGGVMLGADAPFGDTWRFGFAGGYGQDNLSGKDIDSSASVESYYLAAYGGFAEGPASLRFGATHAFQNVDTKRSVAFSTFSDSLTAAYDAATTQVFAEGAWRFDLDAAHVEPYANLAYVHTRLDGFTEFGGAAALTSRGESYDQLYSTLGVRLGKDFSFETVSGRTSVGFGWRHAYSDVTPDMALSFGGAGDFTVASTAMARDALLFDAGVSFDFSEKANITFSYSGAFGKDYNAQAATMKLGVKF